MFIILEEDFETGDMFVGAYSTLGLAERAMDKYHFGKDCRIEEVTIDELWKGGRLEGTDESGRR